MKKMFLLFVLSFVFVMPASAQQVGDSAAGYLKELNSRRPKTGLKYNMEVKSSAGTINYLTYAQDGKWRMDGSFQNETTTVLYDGKETTLISGGMALSQEVDNFSALPDDDELDAFSLGEETEKNGYPCRMVYNDDEDWEMCIYEKLTLPVYAKTGEYTMNVTNIKTQKFPNTLFQLPKGVKKLDFDMQQMMQNMMKMKQ